MLIVRRVILLSTKIQALNIENAKTKHRQSTVCKSDWKQQPAYAPINIHHIQCSMKQYTYAAYLFENQRPWNIDTYIIHMHEPQQNRIMKINYEFFIFSDIMQSMTLSTKVRWLVQIFASTASLKMQFA